jgi:molybdate transport system ATP-binding protein
VIAIAFSLRRGALRLDADIKADGRVLALVGPSGSGKTTTLNMVAGLTRPDSGRIAIGDAVLFDSAAGVDVPPQRRRLGYVFQEPRLFPHMNVKANLLYGAKSEENLSEVFGAIVAKLGIGALLRRRPRDLSGGEKQRVAIGRALLSSPRALLLDEPLSAIDAAKGDQILAMVEEIGGAFALPIVFVSHRQEDIARLASDVATFGGEGVIASRPVQRDNASIQPS